MKRDDLEKVLNSAPVLSEVRNSKEAETLQDFLAHPGLKLFWGLMLGTRQANYAQLQYAQLGTAEKDTHAARIQGTIMGIELVAATALEQAIPSQEANTEEQK